MAIGEGRNVDRQEKAKLAEQGEVASLQSGSDGTMATTNNGLSEKDSVKVLVDFEVKEVLLSLKKLIKQEEAPFLVFQLDQLGINTKVRMYDMSATTYIRQVSVKSLEFKDSDGDPLCLISSSAESGAELLKVEFCKADRSGPDFCTTHKNTEQMIHVTFTSLDVMLHTEALLSAVNFLSSSLSSSSMPYAEKEVCLKTEEKMASAKSSQYLFYRQKPHHLNTLGLIFKDYK
ncbi:hypothetical protein ILYODFUR_013655 [Ilyodon furcidens]|uniref:Uncharacterized protein n=1 Tax=Ilyodon furcidens TaxID=33524 RepID=A0ABV0TJG1_9TELE